MTPTDQQVGELNRRLTRLEPQVRRLGAPVPAPLLGHGALLTGLGPPDVGTGEDGAMYLDLAAGEIYGPKAGGWQAPVFRLTAI
jgi:hypothetical protein